MSRLADNTFTIRDGRATSGTVNLGPDVRVVERTAWTLVLYCAGHRYYGGLSSGGSYAPARFYVGNILESNGVGDMVEVRHIADFPAKPPAKKRGAR